MIKKVAILTSGGDAPGMNNAIRAIVKHAIINNIEPYLVFEGYEGLYNGSIKSAKDFDVDAYISKGGTFIYSARFPKFKNTEVRKKAKQNLDKQKIDALVVIGGDGTYKGAKSLHEMGVKTIALPGTIDNDVNSSDYTIGYDTALNSIVENIEKIKDTAKSHDRVIIVEVMGRDCGDLALFSALATGAHIAITKENKKTPEEIGKIFKKLHQKGKRGLIAIVSENLFNNLDDATKIIEKSSGISSRNVVLGHTQRGGIPTAFERIISTQMGIEAINLIKRGKSGLAVGIINNKIKSTPILNALSLPRLNRKKLTIEINKLNQI